MSETHTNQEPDSIVEDLGLWEPYHEELDNEPDVRVFKQEGCIVTIDVGRCCAADITDALGHLYMAAGYVDETAYEMAALRFERMR